MGFTLGADGLFFLIRAAAQAIQGVIEEILAVRAELIGCAMFFLAIEFHHGLHGDGLFGESWLTQEFLLYSSVFEENLQGSYSLSAWRGVYVERRDYCPARSLSLYKDALTLTTPIRERELKKKRARNLSWNF